MKVRVHDRMTGIYFKSEVYARINTGWYEKQLVHVPSENGGYICFFDYLDKEEDKESLKVLINTILPDTPNEWVYQRADSVDKKLPGYEKLLRKDVCFFEYIGFSGLYEKKSILAELLNGNAIPFKGSIFESMAVASEMSGWTYVETQEDVNNLLENAFSFHDSVLKTLNYKSGAYVNPDRSMYPVADARQVTMCVDSQWCDTIEMVFEGVTALNLRPAGDNYTADISAASLIIKNASIFFCDDGIQEWDENYEGNWITAYGLRWHFVR
ncbi:MAG: hypothetical protein VB106_12880 [Clostridiaceae bacterium]|nr:hypothetical protein [Clostridiaceae bacterium]